MMNCRGKGYVEKAMTKEQCQCFQVDELEMEEASEVEGEWFQEAVTQHNLYFR